MLALIVGLMDKDRPVHASKARRWATIQSTEPLRFTTANEVLGDRTETSAVTGLAEETYIPVNRHPEPIAKHRTIPSDRGKALQQPPCGRAQERSMLKSPATTVNYNATTRV